MREFSPIIAVALGVALACGPHAAEATTETAEATTEATTITSSSASAETGSTTAATSGCPVDPCDVDEYCDWGARSCGAGAPMSGDETAAAASDEREHVPDSARCEPRPSASECDESESPVCGCDGQIHASECHAAAAGVDVDANAGCTPPPETVACGYRLCDPGASYCRIILVNGGESNPDIYDCSAFPEGCDDTPSCECILEGEGCPWTDCYNFGDHFETSCPQG